MAARVRTLAALAAGALVLPLSPLAGSAFAVHIEERTQDNACPLDEVSENNYEDVPEENIFARVINCVTDYGIATGTSATAYSPEENVTRRQMAQFIYRVALLGGVDFDTTTDPGYSDDNTITGETRDAIWGLTNAGVVSGVGGDRFAPNANVTRAQMATFLVGLADVLGLEGFETTEDFFDDDDRTTHEANINRIASEGITIGQGGDRTYGFNNPVLRQQMAAFLARTLDVAVEQDVIESVYAPAPVEGTNERPELVAVEVISTTTASQVTPDRPAGTVITYTFDEQVLETGAPPNAGNFLVHARGGLARTADRVLAVDDSTVRVRFNAVDTVEEAEELTLATVDIDAVRDLEGNRNPEGDRPLGETTGGGSNPLPAGVTDAPDLLSVGNFRQGRNVGDTAVDFTFDQNAFVSNAGGFDLILLNGARGVANDNEVNCVGPAAGTPATGAGSTPSGGTVPGGNGTTTITVICDAAPGDRILAASDVARAAVASGAVSDVQQDADPGTPATGDRNPLQAADVSNGGNTVEPDLVSVELRPSVDGSNGGVDQALFVFDQPVDSADETAFFLYTVTAEQRPGTNARVNTAGDSRQVLVNFAGGTTDVVGANVRDGAVTVAVSPTNTDPDVNEQDEVGVAGTSGNDPGQTAGRTAGPDLTGVAISRGPEDDFGNPGRFRAVYTFDEDVVLAAAANFRLFRENGTQLNGTACVAGSTEDTDNTVRCTGYDDGAGAASSDEIGSAVLGTVDNGAVNNQLAGGGAGLQSNPEGAEATTGGTA